ncbi:MAG: rhodanese-like domain-containing protein [Bacteroidota bacterium]
MIIKQFNDEPLAHYSYAIISQNKMAVVDPARNPLPYYQFAEKHQAKIVAVFETHPHADFVSSHLQIHQETGATIYVSKLVGAEFPHQSFDHNEELTIGEVLFRAIHTPGHSPDSLTFYAKDKKSNEEAMFTGDTLFIGDVGRPDLREKAGNMKAKRIELAKQMYETMQTKYNDYADEVLVYPAHGAGSLCGKNMSDAASSTLGNERIGNWAFKKQSEQEFVDEILKDQPFIPSYFGYDVEINRQGADNHNKSIGNVKLKLNVTELDSDALIIDTRPEEQFKKNHFEGSINLIARDQDDKIETWLGAIVQPEEKFYLVVESISDYQHNLERIAKIGYEKQIEAVVTLASDAKMISSAMDFNLEDFKKNPESYTIIDIRNVTEHKEEPKFDTAENHPLNDLRSSAQKISTDKPLVVHCAGGYRSTAGASILEKLLPSTKVYDLSTAIEEF